MAAPPLRVARVGVLRAEAGGVREEDGPDGDGRRAVNNNLCIAAEGLVVGRVELGACESVVRRANVCKTFRQSKRLQEASLSESCHGEHHQ